MSATQSGVFSLQEFSDTGTLLASGRLYTYVYGTTTFKTAYTDSAASVAHTYTSDGAGGQYIALNARGELPAPLYLTSGSYDLALKRADGSTVWTRRADPIGDISSTVWPISQGGTGATTAGTALAALGAAASGANADITSLTALATTPAVVNTSIAAAQVLVAPTPTLAANAMTIPSAAFSLAFRSTTLGSGAITTITGNPAALTIPSGATLGGINAVQSSIALLILNNAGTLEYAVVNLAGGNDLSEAGLISTTAISAGATSANVVYSATARTSVAYRVVARIDHTQATAGTYITAPSLVQGMGGQAITSMSSLGYGQTWQTVTRAGGTTYYNTTGKPIVLYMDATTSGNNVSGTVTISINGGAAIAFARGGGAAVGQTFVCGDILIPIGASYVVTYTNIAGGPVAYELR